MTATELGGRITRRAGFTLIELLIVIGIIAILSIVVILTLNPAQLLKQARDSSRLLDLGTINKALGIYTADVSGGSTGSASTIYISIPDTSSSCANLGLPTPPPGWVYNCVVQANLRNVDGTGWIPINFTNISIRPPFGSLPVDPTNTISSGYYYTYVTGGSWALAATLESDKYLVAKSNGDGGYNPARYEIGTRLSLIAQSEGLQGWWTLDEGGGTVVTDLSGNNHNATYQGGPTLQESGKLGTAVRFDGINDYANFPSGVPPGLQIGGPVTLAGWVKTTKSDHSDAGIVGIDISSNWITVLHFNVSYFYLRKAGVPNDLTYTSNSLYDGSWHYWVATWDGTTGANGMKLYVDGTQVSQRTSGTAATGSFGGLQFARASSYFNGWLDDIRIYNRALTAAEIQAIYNATK